MARQPSLRKTASGKKRQLQRGRTLSSDRPGNGKLEDSTVLSEERRPSKRGPQVGAVWFQYRLADGETFDYIMDDVIPRFLLESKGNSLYAIAHVANGQHMVDVLLVTDKPVRLSSVTHPDAWARKGARGLASIVCVPGPKVHRSRFVADCVPKFCEIPFLRSAGSIREVSVDLTRMLDSEQQRIAPYNGLKPKPYGSTRRVHEVVCESTSVDKEESVVDAALALERSQYWSVVMEGGKSRH